MKKIKNFIKKINKKSLKHFNIKKTKYKISFNLKSSTTLGLYRKIGLKHELIFNEKVYNEVGFKKYKEVLIHEYAHFLTNLVHGYVNQSHGKEWKQIMLFLGVKDPRARTNSFKNISKKDSDTKVKCKCGISFFSKNRITRMKNGTIYYCRVCSSKFKIK